MAGPLSTILTVAQVCAEVGAWTSGGEASLSCERSDAKIVEVGFADYGSPRGVCGGYQA